MIASILISTLFCQPTVEYGTWQNMPVSYRVEGSPSRQAIREAQLTWGTIAVRFQESPDSPNVIASGALSQAEAARVVLVPHPGADLSFSIILDTSKVNEFGQKRLLAHEFGHVLGFGHSSCASSIMYSPVLALEPSLEDLAARDAAYPVYQFFVPSVLRGETIE